MMASYVVKFALIAKFFANNDKQLNRGENAYASGHVKKMKFYGDLQPPLITGEVQASMRNKTYTVEISFNLHTGVENAKCTCPRGQAICSHMAALLFHAHYNVSTTDKACEWNAPRTSKRVDDAMPKYLEQMFPTKEEYVPIKDKLSADTIANFQKKLGETNVVGFSWLLKPEATKETVQLIPNIDEILFSEEYFYSNNKDEFFKEKCSVTEEEIRNIAAATVGQHQNEGWLITRKMRLTASKFGLVLGACKRQKFPPSLFKQLLEGYDLNRALAVQWGKSNEETARHKFEEVTSLKVEPTGFWLDHCGFLGASPDGLVGEDNLLEIKCPYKFRNINIKQGVEDHKYFFYYENGQVIINPDHLYYHQIQGQLYITNRKNCYFFVWTPNEYECFIVEKSPDWCVNLEILKNFYLNKFIPAIFDMK